MHFNMKYILQLLAYIAAHLAAGLFGLYIGGLSSGTEVFFWPPAGLSLAVLLLFGYRFLPGIFLGAILVPLVTGNPLPMAIATGIGSTITPLITVAILRRLNFRNALERTRDMVALSLVAVPASSALLASIMTAGFLRSGLIASSAALSTWGSIWICNVLSTILLGSFLLVWFSRPKIAMDNRKHILEVAGLTAFIAILGALMFFNVTNKTTPVSYLVFIPLVWSALRFGVRETITIVFAFSVLLVWSAFLGFGPVVTQSVNANLLYIQGFMSIVSLTSMILATTVSERRELERRKDNFISMASHELKTPLTSIKMVTQLLQKMDDKEKVEKEPVYLASIDQQIDKITYLINEMLDLSKIQIGKLNLRKEASSLSSLVDQTVRTMQATTRHKIAIKGTMAREVFMDNERVGQVLINLLSNAIKYSSNEKEILVKISATKNFAKISVKDLGIGIPENKKAQIFERFYRVDEGGERTFSGFGLGLYIAGEIVKQHEGKIWVESREGKGSTFYFTLPLALESRELRVGK
jgi:signal transduction histidine kinase